MDRDLITSLQDLRKKYKDLLAMQKSIAEDKCETFDKIAALEKKIIRSGFYGVRAGDAFESFVEIYNKRTKNTQKINLSLSIPIFEGSNHPYVFTNNKIDAVSGFIKEIEPALSLKFGVELNGEFDLYIETPVYHDTPLADGTTFYDNLKLLPGKYPNSTIFEFVGIKQDILMNVDADDFVFYRALRGTENSIASAESLQQAIQTLQKEKEQA